MQSAQFDALYDERGILGPIEDDDPDPEPEWTPVKVGRPKVNPAHRQAVKVTEKPSGTSEWVGRPRQGFTAFCEARAHELSAKREAKYVKGLPSAE